MSSHYAHLDTSSARPPSLSAGGHEMRDDYVAPGAPRKYDDHDAYLTPYLGLRARLSQTWINRWTVLLLLVLVRVLIACVDLDNNITQSKAQALSACSGVESVGSAMASMPHYLSKGVNDIAATGIEKASNGLFEMLSLTVTGVEELVVFAVNLLTSTYLCLITMAVSGSLHASIALIEDTAGFLNKTLGTISKDFESGIKDFESELNSFLKVVNSGLDLVDLPTVPNLDLNNQLSALNHVRLPSGLDSELQKLNSSIPTFSQVKDFVDKTIETPFGMVKKWIDESTGNYTIDSSLFPVPQKQRLTFCSDNDGIGDFFNSLFHITDIARKIFIAVLLVAAVAACAPMAYLEIRRWHTMKERAKMIKVHAYDPLDVIYIASRPYTSTAGIAIAKPFQSNRRKVLTRWVVAYATSTPALYVLSLGFAGLLGALCQYILFKSIQKEVPALANQVEAFAHKVVGSLEDASRDWANATNTMILNHGDRINNDLFGWVNTTTHGLNNTLNTFVDGMTDVLNATFGGTVLYGPITDVFYCLIGLKIAGIEKGLTWVHDHAHIDFPLFPDNVYSAGAATSIQGASPEDHFLSSPGSGTTDEITTAVDDLMQKLENAARNEAIISTAIIGAWVLILLIGIVRAIIAFFGSDPCREFYVDSAPTDPFSDCHQVQDYGKEPLATVCLSGSDSQAPSNEQRFGSPNDNNSGNQYRGAQYTLDPRPFPSVRATAPYEDRGQLAPIDEKVGYAGARAVDSATQWPGHVRKSSHGDLKMATPGVGIATSGTFEKKGH